MSSRSTVARAFELARESNCRTIDDIKRKLSAEGYDGVHEHLSGLGIKRQLAVVMKNAG